MRLRGTTRRALVYLLLEHQSTFDPMMPLRLLEYACRAWRDYTERPGALRDHLPPLVPILIHQGPAPWRGARSLSHLHAVDGAPSPLPPFIDLHIQLHELHDDDLLSARELTTLARAALYLMKLVAAGTLSSIDTALVARWFALVRITHGPDALEVLVQYILHTDRSGTMIDTIAHEATDEVRDTITTVAERLEARGEARGRERGKVEGRIEGKAELVLDQLTLRFGKLPARITRRVRKGTADDLQRWAARLLSAPTLAEVFADDP